MCSHKVKLVIRDCKVPIYTDKASGRRNLQSSGLLQYVKRVVFCADNCCEEVIVLETEKGKLSLV